LATVYNHHSLAATSRSNAVRPTNAIVQPVNENLDFSCKKLT